MKNVFAPWRASYSEQKGGEKSDDASETVCLFCGLARDTVHDHNEYILDRTPSAFVLLNRYPYNAGHLLVVPNRHVKLLSELSPSERAELMEYVNTATTHVHSALQPDGLNIGINIGRAAGAGIPSHLHIHILPRWDGDTNFMPSLADTKIISFDLNTVYKKLRPLFNPR